MNPGDKSLFERLDALGARAAALYDKPDAGPWELRGSANVAHLLRGRCRGRVAIGSRASRRD